MFFRIFFEQIDVISYPLIFSLIIHAFAWIHRYPLAFLKETDFSQQEEFAI